MKGKITEKGSLMIGRGPSQKLKSQDCPYDRDGGSCGDWCPLFGEPKNEGEFKTWVAICQNKTLVFDEFEDERK